MVRTGLLPHASSLSSSTYKPPSTKDIPPVTLTNIPHVDPAVFRPYLTQFGPLYDAIQRAQEGGDHGDSQLIRQGKQVTRDDGFPFPLKRNLDRKPSALVSEPYRSSASSPVVSPLGSPELERGATSGSGRRVHPLTPLNTIPEVYFEQNFYLENPRTFDIVSERSEVVRPVAGATGVDSKGSNGSVISPGPVS